MLVNGKAQDNIALNDRGLAYGDGVFETIRINNFLPLLFDAHIERLCSGASRLFISLDRSRLLKEIEQLKPDFPENGILKIIVSRGSGGRGYRSTLSAESTRILSLHPLPEYGNTPDTGVNVFICNQRLALQPSLAGIKHLNRLEQVLASLEWPEDKYHEGLMLDMNGNIIEGTRSNIFWAEKGQLYTPALDKCGVEGILRNYLKENIPATKTTNDSSLDRLQSADEVFLCNSVFGVWPVMSICLADDKIVFNAPEQKTFTLSAQNLFNQLLKSN